MLCTVTEPVFAIVAVVSVAVGAVVSAALVTVRVVVAATDDSVTMTVMVFVPSTRATSRPVPETVVVPLTVIVALPLDAVGVTVMESVDCPTLAEYVKVPDEKDGERVPLEIDKDESKVFATAEVPKEVPVPDCEFSLVLVTTARNDFPTSVTPITYDVVVAPVIFEKFVRVPQLEEHDCHW